MNALTPRQQECLRLVGRGLCNKAIARELGIAVNTVKQHLQLAYRLMDFYQPGCHPRVVAALWVQNQ